MIQLTIAGTHYYSSSIQDIVKLVQDAERAGNQVKIQTNPALM